MPTNTDTTTIERTYDTLGERLQRARKRAGLTQAQLAQVLDLSRVTVSNYETDKGEETPPFATIVAWSDVTKHPLEYFAGAVHGNAPATTWYSAGGYPFRDAVVTTGDDVVIDLRFDRALVYQFPMQPLPFTGAGLPDAA